MADDIRQLLHAADGGPGRPDLDDIRRRSRRLAVTRAAAVVAAVLVATAGVVGVAASLVDGDGGRPPVIDDPTSPPASEYGADGADDADEPATITPAQVGRRLLVYGDDGIRRVHGDDEERIWDSPVRDAASDLDGGIVFHEPFAPPLEDDMWGFGTIRWLPAGADEPVEPPVAREDERAVLHAVVEMNGEATVLFTRRTGDLEGDQRDKQEERLYAYGLMSGDETDLGMTARMESNLGGVAVADRQLVLAGCHIHCRIEMRPADATAEADTELIVRSGPHYGLDVEAAVATWVTVAPTDGDRTELTLVLHDLNADDRREIELVTVDHPWETTSVAAIDLTPDLRAVLVNITWYDPNQELHENAILYVDQLDGDPEVHWLRTDGHVRFDVTADA